MRSRGGVTLSTGVPRPSTRFPLGSHCLSRLSASHIYTPDRNTHPRIYISFCISIEHQIKSNSPRSNEQTNTPHQTTPTPHAPTGARICRIPVQPYAPHRINPVAQSALASFVTSSPPGTSLSRCNLSLHEPTRDSCPSTVLLFAPISSQYISSQLLPPFSSLASFVLPRYLYPAPPRTGNDVSKGFRIRLFLCSFSPPPSPEKKVCFGSRTWLPSTYLPPASLCSSLALASFCFRNRNNSRTASNIHLFLPLRDLRFFKF